MRSMYVDIKSLALLLAGIVVISVLVLVGYAIHRLVDISAKKIALVITAIVVLLGSLPPVVHAFVDVWK
jgi:hypothetical protein